jgi:hypothetical protein
VGAGTPSPYFECGGFVDSAKDVKSTVVRGKTTRSLEDCVAVGATWVLAEARGGCANVYFNAGRNLRMFHSLSGQGSNRLSQLEVTGVGPRIKINECEITEHEGAFPQLLLRPSVNPSSM